MGTPVIHATPPTATRTLEAPLLSSGQVILHRTGDTVFCMVGTDPWGIWVPSQTITRNMLARIPAGFRPLPWTTTVQVSRDSDKTVVGSLYASRGDANALICTAPGGAQLQCPALVWVTTDPMP